MILGFCLVTTLGHGIKYINVTTNPVELWASPHSRARIEREYFDSRFEPFYRTEQLIIKSVNMPNIQHNTSKGVLTFGPVFNKTFLQTVYTLQEKIKSNNLNKLSPLLIFIFIAILYFHLGIGVEENKGLEHICFAPLTSPFRQPVQISDCVIQTIWGYFDDNMDAFNETEIDDDGFEVNYLDHIKACSQ